MGRLHLHKTTMTPDELIEENRHLKDQLATLSKTQANNMHRLSDMIDGRNEALIQIGRILRDKESQHKDLAIGSTAFKSALQWAEKYLPDRI